MLTGHVFFFNDTATTEIYTLSLHDALPICWQLQSVASTATFITSCHCVGRGLGEGVHEVHEARGLGPPGGDRARSEEHTSELQSRQYLVCRLLLEKKK